jgi:hypothetical protein
MARSTMGLRPYGPPPIPEGGKEDHDQTGGGGQDSRPVGDRLFFGNSQFPNIEGKRNGRQKAKPMMESSCAANMIYRVICKAGRCWEAAVFDS